MSACLIIAALLCINLAVLSVCVARAPEGFQTDEGFFYGREGSGPRNHPINNGRK